MRGPCCDIITTLFSPPNKNKKDNANLYDEIKLFLLTEFLIEKKE